MRVLRREVKKLFGIEGPGVVDGFPVGRPASVSSIYLGADSRFLCGEAAGLIAASSAEGISYALESGRICANAINSSETPNDEYAKRSARLLERLSVKCSKARMIADPIARRVLYSPSSHSLSLQPLGTTG